jgi:hypothetical protein
VLGSFNRFASPCLDDGNLALPGKKNFGSAETEAEEVQDPNSFPKSIFLN